MDWNTILQFVAEAGHAIAPIIASGLMLIVGTLFYRATGLMPGFVRAYVERAYREREAIMRDSITKALRNGITAAMSRGVSRKDALQEALDHALKTQPDAIKHFAATSNLDRDVLLTMAEREAVDLGIKASADTVVEAAAS